MRGTTMRGIAVQEAVESHSDHGLYHWGIAGVAPSKGSKSTACLPMEHNQLGKTFGDKTAATYPYRLNRCRLNEDLNRPFVT